MRRSTKAIPAARWWTPKAVWSASILKVTRGLLGVLPQDITPELAKAFNLPDQNGALVGNVTPKSPAEKAGIKSGDVIIAFNDKPVTDGHSLRLMVSECAPGSQATVKFIRDGATKNVTVTLAENIETSSSQDNQDDSDADNSKTDALDGVAVTDLDQNVREQLRIPDNLNGALVTDVDPDSNAAEAQLQKNDVIAEINHQPVADSDAAIKLCKQATGDQILLKVWRREGPMAVTLWIGVDNTKKETKAK
jgi:serine protease Do